MTQAQAPAPGYTWSNVTQNLVLANTVTSHPSANFQGGWNGRTKWVYVETADGERIIDPVVAFYRDPPPDAKCLWSTDHGRQAPVFFEKHALTLPPRNLILWRDDKLSSVAQQYQQKYWEDLKYLVRPEKFEDLYKYFDSATLWENGAYNLWNLVNMLLTTAHQRWPQVVAEWKHRIDNWVSDYVHVRPGWQHNQAVLREWNGMQDPLELANAFLDWNYEEVNEILDLQQQDMLREALISQYRVITGVQYSPPQFYPRYPRPACRMINSLNDPTHATIPQPVVATKAIVVACTPAKPTSAQLLIPTLPSRSDPDVPSTTAGHNESVAPRQSSPSVPLNSIPEEPSLAITGTRTIDVSDKPSADSTANTEAEIALTVAPTTGSKATREIPSQVCQTPMKEATPIPEIATKVVTPPSGTTTIIPDRSISDGGSGICKPQPQPTSDCHQSQGHKPSLSVSSAPNRDSESLASGTDASSGKRKRVAGDAPERKSLQKPTSMTGLGPFDADKGLGVDDGRRGLPMHGQMKNKQVGNGAKHRPDQQMQQQGPPPVKLSPHGAHLPQQIQPPFAPTHSIAQIHTQFIPSPSSMISDAASFVPGPPPAQSMAPMMRPPIMPFQDQVPMPAQHHGQPPFDPQFGQPIGMRQPPLMGPQHRAPPMYQDNGYVRQPPYYNNGDSDHFNYMQVRGSQGRRRSSAASSLSRSKVRDDPIHGAVYAMGQSRKASRSSSGGRRPSFGPMAHQGNANPRLHCRNSWAKDFEYPLFDQVFNECPCVRCEEASRSVYIKIRGPVRDDVVDMVKTHFSKYNPIAVKVKTQNSLLVLLSTDLDAIRVVQASCISRTDYPIPGLRSSIYYPLFSKHYIDACNNPKGLPRHIIEARNQMFQPDFQTRRDSNPFRDQDLADSFNGTGVVNGGLGPVENGFGPVAQQNFPSSGPPRSIPSTGFNAMAMPQGPMLLHNHMPGSDIPIRPVQQPPPRQLWEPSATPSRQPTAKASSAKVEPGTISTSDPQVIAQRREKILQEEDWRSKAPSGEVLPANGHGVSITTDVASNHSSQGVTSIKVSLPSEEGSAREAVSQATSRSATPEVHGKPQGSSEEQLGSVAMATEPEGAESSGGNSAASSKTMTPEIVKPIETHKKKTSKGVQQAQPKKTIKPQSVPDQASGYRKTATDLVSAVEDLGIESSSYRKKGAAIPSPVEDLGNFGTVIRHHPSRSQLPTDWATGEAKFGSVPQEESTATVSEVRSRFGEIDQELARHEIEMATSARELETLAGVALSLKRDLQKLQELDPDAAKPRTEPQQAQKTSDQSQHPKKKKNKNRNKKAQGVSLPVSRSYTPTDPQSRGPSPAFDTRPASAAATTNASTSRGPSPVIENNENRPADGTGTIRKKNKKSKRKSTQPASEFSDGLAKDNKDRNVRQGSPLKKAKASNLDILGEKTELEVPLSLGCLQSKMTEQPSDSTYGKLRGNNVGSLRPIRNRPQKNQSQDNKEHRSPGKDDVPPSLATIFQPPTREARNVSPDANLFYQQKLSIDQAKNAGPPPKMSLDATNPQASTNKSAEYTYLINNLFVQPSAKTSCTWASVAKGDSQAGKNDDPFSAGQDEEIPKEWMKKSSHKSGGDSKDEKKPTDQPSPTPSPDKRSHGPTKSKSSLNANAQSFTSSRAASTAIKLNPAAVEFTSSKPSSPALSVVSAAGRAVGSAMVNKKENESPRAATRPVPPKQPDSTAKGVSTQGRFKKPSLPGGSASVDKRFVTPAEQILNPNKVSQPAPPAKEKKASGSSRRGPVPDRSGGNSNFMPIKNPRSISTNDRPVEQQSSQATKAEVIPKALTIEQEKPATKVETVPEPASVEQPKQAAKVEAIPECAARITAETLPAKIADDGFHILDQAALTGTTRKRRTASILKDGLPAAVATPAPTSSKAAVDATAKKGGASQSQGQRSVTVSKPAIAHQSQGQGDRSVAASTPTVAEAQQPRSEQKQGQGEEQKSQDKDWQTVGPAKKNNHTGGGAARIHSIRGGRGGRGDYHGRGGKGTRVGNVEERKGG